MIVRKSYQPFPELTDIPLREQSETSGGHWHKHKREGAVYSSNQSFQKTSQRAIKSPLPSRNLK